MIWVGVEVFVVVWVKILSRECSQLEKAFIAVLVSTTLLISLEAVIPRAKAAELTSPRLLEKTDGTTNPADWMRFNPYKFQPQDILVPNAQLLAPDSTVYENKFVSFPHDPRRNNIVLGRGPAHFPTEIYAKAFDVLRISGKYFQAPAAGHRKEISINGESITLFGTTPYTPLPDNSLVANPVGITPFEPGLVFYKENEVWPALIYGRAGQTIEIANQTFVFPASGKSIELVFDRDGRLKTKSLGHDDAEITKAAAEKAAAEKAAAEKAAAEKAAAEKAAAEKAAAEKATAEKATAEKAAADRKQNPSAGGTPAEEPFDGGSTGYLDDFAYNYISSYFLPDAPLVPGKPSVQQFSADINTSVCWYDATTFKPISPNREPVTGKLKGDPNAEKIEQDIGNGLTAHATLETSKDSYGNYIRSVIVSKFTRGNQLGPCSPPLRIPIAWSKEPKPEKWFDIKSYETRKAKNNSEIRKELEDEIKKKGYPSGQTVVQGHAGQVFKTKEEALEQWRKDILQESLRTHREYAGKLYQLEDGTWSFTPQYRGTPGSSRPDLAVTLGDIPSNVKTYADGSPILYDLHTHGGDDVGFDNNRFSGMPQDVDPVTHEHIYGDLDRADETHTTSYMLNPKGEVWEYVPKSETIGGTVRDGQINRIPI